MQSRESRTYPCGDLVEEHRRLLEQAVEKVVRVAQQVGVTPEDIISLLDFGIDIRDLLAFIASKTSGVMYHAVLNRDQVQSTITASCEPSGTY